MIKLRGFTLIELLTVLAIITILATIGLGGYTQNLKRARDTKRQAELQEIRVALETYRSDNVDIGYPIVVGTDLAAHADFTQNYMNNMVPGDVLRGFPYYYVRSTATTYELCAHLEVPPVTACNGACCNSAGCGDANWTCNYRIIQP